MFDDFLIDSSPVGLKKLFDAKEKQKNYRFRHLIENVAL